MKNAQIWAARTALAKLANADLPAPVLLALAPTLEICERILDDGETMRQAVAAGDGNVKKEDFENFLSEDTTITRIRLPPMPSMVLSYVDLAALRDIISFEGVI